MSNSIADWERIGSSTRYGRYASEIEKKTLLKANSFIKKPTTALDIGCEGGRWSKLLSDTGWKLICTDVDQNNLAICQQRIPTATCKLVSPVDSTLPCASESVKLALCVGVPQVIGADWFIDEAFRVLEKGGLIAGVFWNRSSWRGLLYHSVPALRVKGSGQWYWFPRSYAEWRQQLCARGFTMMNEEGYGWPPFRRNSDSPIVPIATQIEHHLGLRKLTRFSPLVIFIAQKA